MKSIILKKTDRGEADELVVFLSRDLGWLRGVAKNSRKSRVRFGGHLEPFSLVDLAVRSRKKDELVWIDESQVIKGYLRMRSDIAKVAVASYFFELASIFQAEEQPDTGLFDFLHEILEKLDESEMNPLRFMLEEIRLLSLLGYGPRFDSCPGCGQLHEPGEKTVFSLSLGGACHPGCVPAGEEGLIVSPDTLALVRRGLEVNGEAASRLRLSKKGMKELRNVLSQFVRYLRGREINSLVFLEKTGIWSRDV